MWNRHFACSQKQPRIGFLQFNGFNGRFFRNGCERFLRILRQRVFSEDEKSFGGKGNSLHGVFSLGLQKKHREAVKRPLKFRRVEVCHRKNPSLWSVFRTAFLVRDIRSLAFEKRFNALLSGGAGYALLERKILVVGQSLSLCHGIHAVLDVASGEAL